MATCLRCGGSGNDPGRPEGETLPCRDCYGYCDEQDPVEAEACPACGWSPCFCDDSSGYDPNVPGPGPAAVRVVVLSEEPASGGPIPGRPAASRFRGIHLALLFFGVPGNLAAAGAFLWFGMPEGALAAVLSAAFWAVCWLLEPQD